MTPEQESHLFYTIEHFQDVARKNRFAENSSIEHDRNRCVICRPELLPMDPFAIYLEVICQSVKVRRPALDQALIDEIKGDLALMGLPASVSIDSIVSGDEESVRYWADWIRDALSTGLGLISVHSETSHDFSLDEVEGEAQERFIEEKVREIMEYQKENRTV